MKANLILIGFSGTGKSCTGHRLAERLGWRFIDLDDAIAVAAGKSVPAVFAEDGEARFREMETLALRAACAGEHAIVATGGGAIVAEANREFALANGFVVCLEARPDVIYARLQKHREADEAAALRPLLEGSDPRARITALKTQRQAFYAACHATVHTDDLGEAEVAEEVHRALARAGLAFSPGDGSGSVSVKTAGGYYHAHVGWGNLSSLGQLVAARHPRARLFLVADANVFRAHGEVALASLTRAERRVSHLVVPAGEASKTLGQAERLYEWLIAEGAERGDVLVALGGGVVGDLVGFVAATYLRGVAYVQVPTSLLAMVDSSVGGKTAVDHPLGKNLIGAFHSPSLVVADVATLRTLPTRELRSGWAEVVKHAMIMDADLFAYLEAASASLQRLEMEAIVPVVRRNVWLKASVVAADEREGGRRVILNYGHSVGHALEVTSDFALSHGEAVALGMVAAADLAVRLGNLSPADAARQNALLRAFGLATAYASPANVGAVLAAMGRDKKVIGGSLRWVLAERVGTVKVARNVPDAVVRQTVEALIG
ncbi:MAG: 3-dehydroquinate synthase [Chloroflexota bacterium]